MKIKDLVIIKYKKTEKNDIIRYREVKCLCSYEYRGHKKGCPNIEFCKKIPFFEDINECNKKHYYLLYAEFDFKKYKYLRYLEHKNWTGNQIRCLLYWQRSVIKNLKDKIEEIYSNNNSENFYVLGCGSGFKLSFQNNVHSMESTGINVFSTLKLNKIEYEIKPQKIIRLCSLLCSDKILNIN